MDPTAIAAAMFQLSFPDLSHGQLAIDMLQLQREADEAKGLADTICLPEDEKDDTGANTAATVQAAKETHHSRGQHELKAETPTNGQPPALAQGTGHMPPRHYFARQAERIAHRRKTRRILQEYYDRKREASGNTTPVQKRKYVSRQIHADKRPRNQGRFMSKKRK